MKSFFTRNTTEAINLVAYSWGSQNVSEGDEILVTVMEHHSNLVPWQLLAERTGAQLRFIEITDDGLLELADLDALLTDRTKLVALDTRLQRARYNKHRSIDYCGGARSRCKSPY